MVIDIKKEVIGLLVIISLILIPSVIAPVWYGTSSFSEDNLVLHIACEGNFDDSSSEGNDGTQSGGVSITKGIKGRACEFDGVDGDILECSWLNLFLS
jgi:hypothetical protein